MTKTLQLKTNLNCKACVAAVKPHLDGEPSISHWEVDTTRPEKQLTVTGEAVSIEAVQAAVEKAGFNVFGEIAAARPIASSSDTASAAVTYYPLLLLVGFLLGIVGLVELASGGFVADRAMRVFMGGFFLAFSFFKLLDLRGFAESYQMYDVVARRIPAYGYVYPFIELLFGAAYVINLFPVTTSVATVVVMSVSAVGVVQSLLAKRKIRCVCLGTVFNLPMSTVTVVEDGLMIAMAAAMLAFGSHGRSPVSHDSDRPANHADGHAQTHHAHPYH
jgi:copper chaperone CopZ